MKRGISLLMEVTPHKQGDDFPFFFFSNFWVITPWPTCNRPQPVHCSNYPQNPCLDRACNSRTRHLPPATHVMHANANTFSSVLASTQQLSRFFKQAIWLGLRDLYQFSTFSTIPKMNSTLSKEIKVSLMLNS